MDNQFAQLATASVTSRITDSRSAASASAWIITINAENSIAIGHNELLHIITDPALYKIPGARKHCRHIVNWRSMSLPVMDISGKVFQQESQISNQVGVIAYHPVNMNRLQYAAINLPAIPVRTSVSDAQSCQLNEENTQWLPYAISCFKHHDHAIPVIDLARIFQ